MAVKKSGVQQTKDITPIGVDGQVYTLDIVVDNEFIELAAPVGHQGPQGEQGARGPKGDKGDRGDVGPRGATGEQGLQGNKGDKGSRGEKGNDGDVGPRGPQGVPGPANRITVGSVQTGAPGTQATFDLYGYSPNQVIDIVIPRGDKGDQGIQGIKGDKGDKGDTGEKGIVQGPTPPADTEKLWADTTDNTELLLVPGPQGDQGIQGIQGVKGDPGGWVNASIIADGVDLNTLTTPGMYSRTTSVGVTTALNYPANSWAGFIEVMYAGANTIIQRATAISSDTGSSATLRNMWYRSKFGGTWQQWAPILTDDEMNSHISATDPHTQYARKSVGNTFTTLQTIDNSVTLRLDNTGTGPAGANRWEVHNNSSGSLVFYSRNNDSTNPYIAAQFNRNGDTFFSGKWNYSGAGSPEGVKTASVGARYTDTAATNGAIEWIKATGSGSTGWKVVYGDTGWRDVMSLVDATRWDNTPSVTQYAVMRRVNETVTVLVKTKRTGTLGGSVGSSTDGALFYVPSGWQAYKYGQKAIATRNGQWASSSGTGFNAIAVIGGVASPATWTLNDGVEFNGTWITNDAWPTTLPGVAG